MRKLYITGPEEIQEKYFTLIPNVFFDEIIPVLEPMAAKILIYFIRNTYGFKRDKYSRGIREIAMDNNVSDKMCNKHVSDLVKTGILVITREADRRNHKTREYRLIQGDLLVE